MLRINQPFEQIVIENTDWLLRYIKSKLRNIDLAEDILQEIFVKAFRAYNQYEEHGKLQGWLMRIAQNTIRNYLGYSQRYPITVSLDSEFSDSSEAAPKYYLRSSEQTPEEICEIRETIGEIMLVLSKLPLDSQKVFFYRFIKDQSIAEVSNITGLPQGTVKSKTHYTVNKIKNNFKLIDTTIKGDVIMDCKDIFSFLFIYANGTILEQDKKIVENHLDKCDVCKDIVSALRQLIPQMKPAYNDDEISHFIIYFPYENISFSGIGFYVDPKFAVEENKALAD